MRALFGVLLFASVVGAQVSDHNFKFRTASYHYSVFAPEDVDRPPAILLLHGAGGRGMDMLNAWKDFAAEKRIVLVAPDFPLDAQFETTVPELFPALMETARKQYRFDPKRVYVFGYSAGGYCAYDAAALNSNYFAAVGIFAMFISPEYEGIVQQAKRKTPVAIYIGDKDQFMTFAQTRRTRDLLLANHFPVHYVELRRQDHNYFAASSTVNADVWKFMQQFSLPN